MLIFNVLIVRWPFSGAFGRDLLDIRYADVLTSLTSQITR